MERFKPHQEKLNALHSAHLTNGEKPIIASVEGYDNIPLDKFLESNKYLIEEAEKDSQNINVNYSEGNESSEGYLSGGPGKYSMSPIGQDNKVSTGFLMCTGVVGVGKDKITGANISFLTHQYPDSFLVGKPEHEQFMKDLELRLLELKEKCLEGSIDVVVVGGKYLVGNDWYENEYADSVELLKKEVVSKLDFEPVVITGPKVAVLDNKDTESVLFDTKNRRLYLSRPFSGDSTSEAFMPKNIVEHLPEWKDDLKALNKKKNENKTEKSGFLKWFSKK